MSQQKRTVPNGLHITLKLSIGNFDDEFNMKRYERLTDFSLTLKKNIIAFCDKTVEEVSSEISTTESELNKKLQYKEWNVIHESYTKVTASFFSKRKQEI